MVSASSSSAISPLPAFQKVWQPLGHARSSESQTLISNSVCKQVQFLTPDKDHGFVEKTHVTF